MRSTAHTLTPRHARQLGEFQLIGVLLGLAIYNSVLLNVSFPPVLYRKLYGEKVGLLDLKRSFPLVARSLQQLLDYDGDDVEDVFCLNFQVTNEYYGAVQLIDLVPNGGDEPVTSANKERYVELYVDYMLNASIASQFDAFKRGFDMVVGGPALGLFRSEEIEKLVCGNHDFNIAELEEHALYDGGFNKHTPVVRWFWELMHEWPESKQRRVLAFVTGSDRVPIGGLAKLDFKLHRKCGDSEVLPTAGTCFNSCFIPVYSSKAKLERKLNQALDYGGEGMHLK